MVRISRNIRRPKDCQPTGPSVAQAWAPGRSCPSVALEMDAKGEWKAQIMGKIQVLLVDDEKEFVEGLSERMAVDGFETKVAFSGEEGLEAFGENPPDVLVLDLGMPGIGGMEVLERVRRDHPQTQVIILTGRGGKGVEEAARERGAFEILEKPVDYSGLKKVVNLAWGMTKRVSQAVADDLALTFLGDIPAKARSPLEQPAPAFGGLSTDGLRVLLVDDNEEYVTTLADRLELRDLESDTALSGEDALSIMGVEPPDVMVLDLSMPGIGGMEVLKRVKKDHPQTEVIILTGHGSLADREEAVRLGAAEYLNKPVGFRSLVGAVQAAGQKAKLHRRGEGAK